jgi:hypothetical protein
MVPWRAHRGAQTVPQPPVPGDGDYGERLVRAPRPWPVGPEQAHAARVGAATPGGAEP